MRKLINSHQKAKIALAAIKENKTFAQLSSEHHVHPSQISEWKKSLEKEAYKLFCQRGSTREQERIAELERMIGQRELELDWLKKKVSIK